MSRLSDIPDDRTSPPVYDQIGTPINHATRLSTGRYVPVLILIHLFSLPHDFTQEKNPETALIIQHALSKIA
jgi:hypothetical protein